MNELDFTGRLIVITGVGRAGQVGEAVAAGFIRRGATVALLGHHATDVNARAASLSAHATSRGAATHDVSAHAGDLADEADAQRLAADVLAQTRDRFEGAVHAVVCVAGGFGFTGPVDRGEVAQWQPQFAINLETAYHTTRAFLPAVRAARGSFVYFGSASVVPGGRAAGITAYAAAKSGVLALMRAVAVDERSQGVRANAIAPSQVRTGTNLAAMGEDHAYVERDSIADVAAFLASPLARDISGQVFTLA